MIWKKWIKDDGFDPTVRKHDLVTACGHYLYKDEVFNKTLIDKHSLKIIEGSVVDFKKELIGNSFVIKNPKASSSCGCGLSFSV